MAPDSRVVTSGYRFKRKYHSTVNVKEACGTCTCYVVLVMGWLGLDEAGGRSPLEPLLVVKSTD
jgi:hypothetical protein